MKILIVDDNRLFREEMINQIKNKDHEIYQCEDGIYAESMYDEHKPDIVLMDIKMKYMNGLEATKILTTKYPEANIILVTNLQDERLEERAVQYGAKGFLLNENLNRLNEFIKRW
jgi:two-component system, NarL family, response regulator DegU